MQLKHAVGQNGASSFFSPEIGPDAESTVICQNKMATTNVSLLRNFKHTECNATDREKYMMSSHFQLETVDHNQNYVKQSSATQSDDEHAHPSYSDVISNNAAGEGLFVLFLSFCVVQVGVGQLVLFCSLLTTIEW